MASARRIDVVPTQNSESQRNPGVSPAFRVLSRDNTRLRSITLINGRLQSKSIGCEDFFNGRPPRDVTLLMRVADKCFQCGAVCRDTLRPRILTV
jgi:hypothetical protein